MHPEAELILWHCIPEMLELTKLIGIGNGNQMQAVHNMRSCFLIEDLFRSITD